MARVLRIAGTIAIHLVVVAMVAGVIPMFVLALVDGNGAMAALGDVADVIASLDPRRISRAGLPYYGAAVVNAVVLPLAVAIAAAIAPPPTTRSAARRALLLAALAFLVFFIAIRAIYSFSAARLSVSASWSMPFFALDVLVYDLLVVPGAAVAYALTRRLRLLGA